MRPMIEADIGLRDGKSMWPTIESARSITASQSYKGMYVTYHIGPYFGERLIREMGLKHDPGSVIVNGVRLAWDGTPWAPPPNHMNIYASERAAHGQS